MKIRLMTLIIAVGGIILLLSLRLTLVPAKAQGPSQTTLVSVASDGTQADNPLLLPRHLR